MTTKFEDLPDSYFEDDTFKPLDEVLSDPKFWEELDQMEYAPEYDDTPNTWEDDGRGDKHGNFY